MFWSANVLFQVFFRSQYVELDVLFWSQNVWLEVLFGSQKCFIRSLVSSSKCHSRSLVSKPKCQIGSISIIKNVSKVPWFLTKLYTSNALFMRHVFVCISLHLQCVHPKIAPLNQWVPFFSTHAVKMYSSLKFCTG